MNALAYSVAVVRVVDGRRVSQVLEAKPVLVKRRASKELGAVWRVLGASGWRHATRGELTALEEAYGQPGALCEAI